MYCVADPKLLVFSLNIGPVAFRRYGVLALVDLTLGSQHIH
jgi:hypothetical protein